VAIIYSGGELFACRHCNKLAYASQNETPPVRAIRRARKIRMRLGTGFSFAEPFPDEPPGMHWRTCLRMRPAAARIAARCRRLVAEYSKLAADYRACIGREAPQEAFCLGVAESRKK